MRLYPVNCAERLGFEDVKELLLKHCLSTMGKSLVQKMQIMTNTDQIAKFLHQTEEFKNIILQAEPLNVNGFYDIKRFADKLRIEGSYLLEDEWHELNISLQTVFSVIKFFQEREGVFPNLEALFENLAIEKPIATLIDRVIDPKGKMKTNASSELLNLNQQIQKGEQEVRSKMDSLYKLASSKGWTADGSLTVRDGRICIPIVAEHKRKIKGFIHDESASGQTVYLEPEEVFNLNNKLRDLAFDRRREVIKILKDLSDQIRPYNSSILAYHGFLTKLDFVRAKALFAIQLSANLPKILKEPKTKLRQARHPLLSLSFAQENKSVVPLNAHLDENLRILVVSGPNAGGKSVCMKTIGLLQMMFQSGLLVPVDAESEMGIFQQIFADIGDDQSIESDLSTYSAHLTKMKYFVENAGEKSLILIDEFGTGTDPQFGGPMAEAVLEVLNKKMVKGVITTHYSNLKHFAGNTEGLENASMLFDHKRMKPLYVLDIGKPGSSYAFEIAQNIGLQKDVIQLAKEKTGVQQNQVDSLLVKLEKDKRDIHLAKVEVSNQQNKVKQLLQENEKLKAHLEENKRVLLKEAKLEAQQIIKKANKLVENTIAEIKETKADKTVTKQLRLHLKQELDTYTLPQEAPVYKVEDSEIEVGNLVKLIDGDSVGEVISINKNNLVVAFGDLRSVVKRSRIQKVSHKQMKKMAQATSSNFKMTDQASQFNPSVDLRGMRTENAIQLVETYMDRAIMLGFPSLKVLHGKGDGILRKMVRDYLKKYKEVSHFEDEHADRGGDGITYVYFK
ncbi:MAG: endonuclease MutS2 [Pedobacter sp.]|nr:MAG: endonuclease MutS2 [Pedobacter sp.]